MSIMMLMVSGLRTEDTSAATFNQVPLLKSDLREKGKGGMENMTILANTANVTCNISLTLFVTTASICCLISNLSLCLSLPHVIL